MPADKFEQIKAAIKEQVETLQLPAFTDRYVEPKDQRFAVVYFGSWEENPDTLEETEVTGTLSVEVFAMNDTEIASYIRQIRPLLKQWDSDLVSSFQPSGGEYTPREENVRPSAVLTYAVAFTDPE